MATIYQEQPRAADGSAAGLVAGLVLVLAIIALVFLATRANLGGTNSDVIETTPTDNSAGSNTNLPSNGSVNTDGSPEATVQ